VTLRRLYSIIDRLCTTTALYSGEISLPSAKGNRQSSMFSVLTFYYPTDATGPGKKGPGKKGPGKNGPVKTVRVKTVLGNNG